MNTFTRLSTISTSDIVAIRDKYYAENPVGSEHGWFSSQRPVSSLSSNEGQEVPGTGHVVQNGYRELSSGGSRDGGSRGSDSDGSDGETEDSDAILCGAIRKNQVNLRTTVFTFDKIGICYFRICEICFVV